MAAIMQTIFSNSFLCMYIFESFESHSHLSDVATINLTQGRKERELYIASYKINIYILFRFALFVLHVCYFIFC